MQDVFLFAPLMFPFQANNVGDKPLRTKIHSELATCYLRTGELVKALQELKARVLLNLQDIQDCWYSFIKTLLDYRKFEECHRGERSGSHTYSHSHKACGWPRRDSLLWFFAEISKLNSDELEVLGNVFFSHKSYSNAVLIYDEAIVSWEHHHTKYIRYLLAPPLNPINLILYTLEEGVVRDRVL